MEGHGQGSFRKGNWRRRALIALGILSGLFLIFHRPLLLGLVHRVALHYAARRAAHTGGRLALLYVVEPTELQHWLAVEELAREERREAAAKLLASLGATR